jgi:hypothetical protein
MGEGKVGPFDHVGRSVPDANFDRMPSHVGVVGGRGSSWAFARYKVSTNNKITNTCLVDTADAIEANKMLAAPVCPPFTF